jgi:versiconal hemiacetal acetate esterase
MIGSVEELRAQYAQLGQMLLPQLPPPSDAVDTSDGEVKGVKYRLYTPKEAAKKGLLPVAIWAHGGGWVTGDVNADDPLCRILAEAVPSIIVNVDYRLAPEHKYPTQLEDTLTVYNWVSSLFYIGR